VADQDKNQILKILESLSDTPDRAEAKKFLSQQTSHKFPDNPRKLKTKDVYNLWRVRSGNTGITGLHIFGVQELLSILKSKRGDEVLLQHGYSDGNQAGAFYFREEDSSFVGFIISPDKGDANLKPYNAIVGTGASNGKRVSVLARDLADARRKLEAVHGAGNIFDLHNEDEANKARGSASVRVLEAEVVFYRPEQGGRTHVPTSDYRPHFSTKPDEMLGVRVLSFSDSLLGKPLKIAFELIYDGVDYSALAPGTEFKILEGPRVVGSGVVRGEQ
jgi:hypothetical protein